MSNYTHVAALGFWSFGIREGLNHSGAIGGVNRFINNARMKDDLNDTFFKRMVIGFDSHQGLDSFRWGPDGSTKQQLPNLLVFSDSTKANYLKIRSHACIGCYIGACTHIIKKGGWWRSGWCIGVPGFDACRV